MLKKEVPGAVSPDQEYEHRDHHRCQRQSPLTGECFFMAVSLSSKQKLSTSGAAGLTLPNIHSHLREQGYV
jgi:hypothetical protein